MLDFFCYRYLLLEWVTSWDENTHISREYIFVFFVTIKTYAFLNGPENHFSVKKMLRYNVSIERSIVVTMAVSFSKNLYFGRAVVIK